MDATRAYAVANNGVASNGCDTSKAMDYNLSANHVNGASLSSEKILQLCSARTTALSRLNETFINNNVVERQSMLVNTNGHSAQPPSLPLPPTPSATSFSNFPRFPHPSALEDNRLTGLQPRLNPVSRRTRHFVPNESKDEYYWQKRRKNNEAARKSREKRRTIDSVLEEKVLILSHENKLLRNELYALKVKYGEIKSESTKEKTEIKQQEKAPTKIVVSPTPSSSSFPKNEGSSCNCFRGKSSPATSPTLPTHTAITLPQVNVILESDKLTSDTSSSAKLVLSNLASGTLILSPINLSSKAKAVEQVAIENGGSSACSDGRKQEEIKEVEAANTLANLFRCASGAIIAGSVVPEKKHNGCTSSGESSDSSVKESKNCQSLPCKLRFKASKVD